MTIDFLIVGQGLAGSLLAWNLLEAGCKILIIDNGHIGSATMVGAGIVNPITGPRLAPCWRLEPLLAESRRVYRILGAKLGKSFYREKELVRFFVNDEERALWMQKRSASGTNRYLGAMRASGWKPEIVEDPFGSFSPGGSGHLDMGSLIGELRKYFENRGCLINEKLIHTDVVPGSSMVQWKKFQAKKIIFCQGYLAKDNPWFQWLPFNPAKGEILDLEIHNSPQINQILNRGKWLLPKGQGHYRAGSTYCWDAIDLKPSAAGKEEILSGLKSFLKIPFQVIGHTAGVRPILKDYKPVLGLHPQFPQLGIFNGLGSKGALMAPFFAKQMANFLMGQAEIEKEINLLRFI